MYDSLSLFSAVGISSWGRKVGRRLEQLSISDNETLTYTVNPVASRSVGEEREEDRSGGCMHGGEERSPVAKNPKNICTVKMKG